MHYGIDHNVSMTFYNDYKAKGHEEAETKVKKEFKEFDMFKPKQELIRCKICKDKRGIDRKFFTEKSFKYHQILTHFFGDFANISSESVSIKCPKCKVKFPSR